MNFIEKVKEFAELNYDKNDITHGLPHILGVLKNALKLQEILGGDKELIEIAVYLHDCDYSKGIKDHAEASSLRAKEFLTSIGYDKIEQVVQMIMNHSLHLKKPDASLEAKILFDADKMETLKPSGILRVVIYHGKLPYEQIIEKLQKYCIDIYDKLYFDESRKIMKEDYEKNKKIIEELSK